MMEKRQIAPLRSRRRMNVIGKSSYSALWVQVQQNLALTRIFSTDQSQEISVSTSPMSS